MISHSSKNTSSSLLVSSNNLTAAEIAANNNYDNASSSSSNNNNNHNSSHHGQYYVVSRNGKLLSWQQIHEQYRRVIMDNDEDDVDSSSSPNSITNDHNNTNNNNNTPLDSNQLLQLLPRGAYTTCRTVKGGTHIYQLDYHVRRLANSAKSILEVHHHHHQTATLTSTSFVGSGDKEDEEEEDKCREYGTDNDNDGRNDKVKTSSSSTTTTTTTQSLTTSNHPIQHDRTLSTFEINQLNITNVAWEHDMALKCIRNTLREFCSRYGILRQQQQRDDDDDDDDGVKYDTKGSCSSNGGGEEEEEEEEEKDIDEGSNGDANNDDDDEKKAAEEFKITLLATWEKKKKKNTNDSKSSSHTTSSTHSTSSSLSSSYQSVLYCHVGLLKPKVSSHTTTRVLIHGHGRENALAKDSKWVFDREKLTRPGSDDTGEDKGKGYKHNKGGTQQHQQEQQPFEEIILINDNGELLEGTQTNFYVVSSQQPNTIITANEGILYGSVRDSVLRACRYHEIPVELRPPTLQDLKGASGVFISSTSRWVMPVHEVCLGDLLSFQNNNDDDEEGGGRESSEKKDVKRSYFYGNCETTENIRRWVLEDVESRSTPIY